MNAKRVSEKEIQAAERRERSLRDVYPQIADYHQNDFLSYFDHLNLDYYIERKRAVQCIDTKDQALAYQSTVREHFINAVGPLPTGNVNRNQTRNQTTHTFNNEDGYRIDNVYIETLPNQYMTANFYIPSHSEGSFPAILLCCGHAEEGKAHGIYVSFCVEAVLNGFCVLVFDPWGQGERSIQPADPITAREPVGTHCLLDQLLSITGKNLASYMINDGIQAVNYLISRPEVDSTRIAVTGNSGGGTMAAYLGAYDSRIQAIAPCCYITELRAMLYRISAQDAEQCLPDFMATGLDHSDLVTAAAPKPYWIGADLFDFFPIDGTRDAYIEAKGMYRLLGAAENLGIGISSKGHGFWYEMRADVLRFLCRHLNVEYKEDKKIKYAQLPTNETLKCETEKFPALAERARITSFVERNVMDFTKTAPPGSLTRLQAKEYVKALLKISVEVNESAESSNWKIDNCGEIITIPDNGTKDNLLVSVGGGAADPEFLRNNDFAAAVTIHPRGTGPDLPHQNSSFGMLDPDTAASYNARMLGKTLQGMRVSDVLAGIQFIRAQEEWNRKKLVLHGVEEHALTALYAALLSGVDRLLLEGLLVSYHSILHKKEHAWGPSIFVEGLLNHFDVKDLLALFPAEQVEIHGYLDAMKQKVDGMRGHVHE